MTRYALYGAGLDSTIDFPELRESDAVPAKWQFTAERSLPEMRDAVELGAERIYGTCHARLFRHADGHRITVDDTGVFDIAPDGRRISWEERAESWPDFVRAHLMGRVLATTMFNDGWLPLHGSAVAVRDGVIAFLAPKGYGKSTLALALTQAGARLVTDDTLPIEPASSTTTSPRAWPGVHSLRVRTDAVQAVGLAEPELETREGKRLLTGIDPARRADAPGTLVAIYLLDPVVATAMTESVASLPARTPLPPMLAAVGVVAHVKIGGMLGPSAAAAMLERSAAIATQVPVYRLHLPRDLDALPRSATAIAAWHGGVA